MSQLTTAVVIAVITLIGSATVAALIAARWQRNQYEADTLHAAFKSVMEGHARLNGDAIIVVSRLDIEARTGHIWEFQRQEMTMAMEAAQQHAVELASRVNVCAGVMEDPEATMVLDDLVEAARELTRKLGLIQGWYPSPSVKDGIVIRIREGTTHSAAVEVIRAAMGNLIEQNRRFIRVARVRWRDLLDILPR